MLIYKARLVRKPYFCKLKSCIFADTQFHPNGATHGGGPYFGTSSYRKEERRKRKRRRRREKAPAGTYAQTYALTSAYMCDFITSLGIILGSYLQEQFHKF